MSETTPEIDAHNLELEICSFASGEGLGSVYERIVLRRFLAKLAEELDLRSVLEYGASISKGYDNLAWMDRCEVTVYDPKAAELESGWRPNRKVKLVDQCSGMFDLVWSFAQVQRRPERLAEMVQHTQRYVLVFVPNILNWGTPFHWCYHALTRVECHHAEQGGLLVRSRAGLESLARSHGLKVVRSGYVDMPYLPDIGFSIRELKGVLGIPARDAAAAGATPSSPAATMRKVEWLMGWERRALPEWAQSVLAHHCWVLGERNG
jgi:hypothetical protein